jgi:hypothetical protein
MEVGYFPLAILLAFLFGSGMVLGVILNGPRKLRPCVSVGNNSFAIVAACQGLDEDIDAHLRRVQWGAAGHEEMGGRAITVLLARTRAVRDWGTYTYEASNDRNS